MGLDMNLYRKVYNLELKPSDKKTERAERIIDEGQRDGKSRYINNTSVCYWRKFNALHKYMRDHFGRGGEDNCVDMSLDIEDIKTLVALFEDLLKQIEVGEDGIITNQEVCEEMLPPEDGFFFGSTALDSYYVEDIKDTIEKLNGVIEDHKKLIKAGVEEYDIEYYYRAWY